MAMGNNIKIENTILEFDELPLLPIRDVVIFPYMIIPLSVGRDKSIEAVEKAMVKDKLIFICTQKDYMMEYPSKTDLYEVGVISKVIQMLKLPDGTLKILIEGLARSSFEDYKEVDGKYFTVKIFPIVPKMQETIEVKAEMRTVVDLFQEYFKLNKAIPIEITQIILNIEEADKLVDTIASYLSIKIKDKQNLLSMVNTKSRLKFLAKLLVEENEILGLEQKIHGRVKGQIEKAQREYYLNEQIKAIQKELHKKDENGKDTEELKQKIKDAQMSEEAQELASKELKRLEKMAYYSPEATVSRTYIEWLVSLPWKTKTDDNLNIKNAKIILDEDHFGLEKAKERILEYLSVCKLTDKLNGPILCFVGPPGVGKTSIAKSIARAMGRKFVRISLGGVRDEAEIRGHRRTYIGALPGRVIQSVKRAGTKNPVFLLDEIDKLGADFRGDPAAALLEVLDSEQNSTFADHYLEVDFDLSGIMFITTANNLYNIPPALLDRMEVVEFSGYTTLEKKNISKKYLIPKQTKNMGLTAKDINFSDESLEYIISKYTEEAGVRNLDREIASVCRKIAKKKAETEEGKKLGVSKINKEIVEEFLGIPKYNYDIFSNNEIGVATGLAWTEYGGEILNIEVSKMKSKGGLSLTLTGKLGEVMKESAQTGLSYLRANAKKFGISEKAFDDTEIHIHVPEGGIPKDGPSAGITMTTAMLSAFTRRKIKTGIAMTGEITLTGKILPIGGLKEKLLAAYRVGLKKIFIPEYNKKDLKDIPKEVLDKIEIVQVKHFSEIVDKVLTKS
jgi:ATP-dependent Lon protease